MGPTMTMDSWFFLCMMTPTIAFNKLTHWGRVTHICVSKLTIIGSDNGLLAAWYQTIILTNAVILLIASQEKIFREISTEDHTFSFTHMHLIMSSARQWPFFLSPHLLGEVINTSYPHNQDIAVGALARTATLAESIFVYDWAMAPTMRRYSLCEIFLCLKPCSVIDGKLPRIHFSLEKFIIVWCKNNRFLSQN